MPNGALALFEIFARYISDPVTNALTTVFITTVNTVYSYKFIFAIGYICRVMQDKCKINDQLEQLEFE